MTGKKIEVLAGRSLVEGIAGVVTDVDEVTSRWRDSHVVAGGDVVSSVESALGNLAPTVGARRIVIDMLREMVDKADKDAGSDPASTLVLGCRLVSYLLRLQAAGNNVVSTVDAVDVGVGRQLRACLRDLLRRPTLTDVHRVVETTATSKVHVAVIKEALAMAGIDGRIFFETKRVPQPEVELRMGYCFDTAQAIMAAVGSEEWHAYDVRVACIDGFCETAAELDRLLGAAHETREPLVIFARQFSQEVLRTIAVNNRRRMLNVVPVIVPFDADSANVLKDIAVVAGGDVVSSLEGRLISTVDFYALPIVREVKCVTTATTIVEDSTVDDAAAQVDSLRDGMEKSELSAPFMLRRARALTSRTVFVRMPERDMKSAIVVDRTLRRVRSAISYGVISTERLRGCVRELDVDPALRAALDAWCDALGEVPTPVNALDAALVSACANSRLIATCGAVLS